MYLDTNKYPKQYIKTFEQSMQNEVNEILQYNISVIKLKERLQ